jgi:hypothetical protein
VIQQVGKMQLIRKGSTQYKVRGQKKQQIEIMQQINNKHIQIKMLKIALKQVQVKGSEQ